MRDKVTAVLRWFAPWWLGYATAAGTGMLLIITTSLGVPTIIDRTVENDWWRGIPLTFSIIGLGAGMAWIGVGLFRAYRGGRGPQ